MARLRRRRLFRKHPQGIYQYPDQGQNRRNALWVPLLNQYFLHLQYRDLLRFGQAREQLFFQIFTLIDGRQWTAEMSPGL